MSGWLWVVFAVCLVGTVGIVLFLVGASAVAHHPQAPRTPAGKYRLAFHPWEKTPAHRKAIAAAVRRSLGAWLAGRQESKAAYRYGFWIGNVLVQEAPINPRGVGAPLFHTADGAFRVERVTMTEAGQAVAEGMAPGVLAYRVQVRGVQRLLTVAEWEALFEAARLDTYRLGSGGNGP